MRLVVLVLLASCWRGGGAVTEPQPSFVARTQALGELQLQVEAFVPKLEYVMQRIVGLASEAERDAIREDLSRLDRELVGLADYAADARTRGDDPAALDAIQRKLEQVALALADLRAELRYAKTTEQIEALDALSRPPEETGPLTGRRINGPADSAAVSRRALILRRVNAIRSGGQRIGVISF